MTALAVTGLGVVAATGVGREAFAGALGAPPAAPPPPPPPDSPEDSPFALADFDARALLGRRGTSLLDRCTAIALVACADALDDSGLDPRDATSARIGISLGTTTGSLRSMSDYTRETLVEERPYLVNPGQFPNTVINCASGQAAIRHGLHGINSTLAGGQIAFYNVLRLAARALRLGYIDATLAGAVEELTPHRAWQSSLARANGSGPPVGEGAAVLVLERAQDARAAGRRVHAEILATSTGFHPGGEGEPGMQDALARQIEHARTQAGVGAEQLAAAVCTVPAETADGALGERAVTQALGAAERERLSLSAVVGDCGAATAALQVAALVCRHRGDSARDGQCSLALGWTPEGGVAATILKGFAA
jgi:3-oxoacyl-[acyl-carrier-protein] synthase II